MLNEQATHSDRSWLFSLLTGLCASVLSACTGPGGDAASEAGSGTGIGAETDTDADTDADLEDRVSAVRELIEGAIEPGAGGVVVGIRAGDRTILLEGFGSEEPLDGHTIFEVGSVTKQFTAALILMAAEEGALSLDDELRTRLPDYPETGEGITIRHLLAHTSGIPNYTDFPAVQDDAFREWSQDELVAIFSNEPLDFQPGAAWKYSNSGYILLGMIAEDVFGQTYDTLLEDKVFSPLGMDSSGYCDLDPATLNRSHGHYMGIPVPSVDMSVVYAAGAICSSADDLLTWSDALHGGDLFNTRIDESGSLNDGSSTHYGYGLLVGTTAWRPTIGHGGDIPGTSTKLVRYLETAPSPEFDLVLISNRVELDLSLLEDDLVTTLVGSVEEPITADVTDTDTAAPFLGEYRHAFFPTAEVVFNAETQQLTIGGGELPSMPLTQRGDTLFVAEEQAIYVRFFPERTPRELELESGGLIVTLRTP